MFKKTSLVIATLAALGATGASAAEVELYGVIDTSLVFEATDADQGAGRENTLYMSSGEEWGSRWGIRGKEDLGNGYTVGFDLQSGIRTDDGTMQYSRMFAREASIYIKGDFGKFTMGRMDTLIGTRTSAGKMAVLSAFGDGYGPYTPCVQGVMSEYGYVDNAVFYESPNMAGVTLRAQYSMGPEGVENKSNNTATATANRYGALTAMYAGGPLTLFLGADTVIYGHDAGVDVDDSYTVTFGGKYAFDAFNLHFGAQYFNEVSSSTIRKYNAWTGMPAKLTGYGLTVSAGIPAGEKGKVIAALAYLDAEAADSTNADTDVSRMMLGVGYQHDFSKRTHFYAIATAGQDEIKTETAKNNPDYYKAVVGIRHLF